MRPAHRAMLALCTLILAGQTLLYAYWAFLVVPMLVRGIGPDTMVSESRAEALTALYWGAAMVLVALNIWVCGRMVRTLVRGTSSATPLLVASVIEVLVMVRAVLVGWPAAVAGAAAVLTVLVTCHRLDRRTFKVRSSGALWEETASARRMRALDRLSAKADAGAFDELLDKENRRPRQP